MRWAAPSLVPGLLALGTAILTTAAVTLPGPGFAQSVSAPTKAARAAKGATTEPADASETRPAGKRRDPAASQAAIDSAAKLLDAGKSDQAVAVLTSSISGGNLPPSVMARALYLRGTAYRKLAKPALAISDLTSALWLKGGLNETDRADATQQRSGAYAEAGLTEQGQSVPGSGGSGVRKRTEATAAFATNSSDAATSAASGTSSGGFFGSLFGGNGTAAPAEQPPARAAKPPRAVTPAPTTTDAVAPPAVAAPPRSTHASGPAQATIVAATIAPAATASAKATPHGAYQARVALVRTKQEADAVLAKLKVEYAAVIGEHTPTIDQKAFGNMGTFFQVRVGPYASTNDAQTVCGKLKGRGFDCVPVDN